MLLRPTEAGAVVFPMQPWRLLAGPTSPWRICVCDSVVVIVCRDYRPSDENAIVALSLRAWEPVFASVRRALGDELFRRLRGDWRVGQEAEVRAVLADPEQRVWVADDAAGGTTGFVAAKLHREQKMGEIYMIAVDPSAQGNGIGAMLTEAATDWLRWSGMRTAMIETGGDPGHAPARRLYEKAGYSPLLAVRFFKSL